MMRIIRFLPACILLFYLASCEKLEDSDRYRRPDWLSGKLFDQMIENEELSIFAEALKLTGYDTIVNVSGSFTIFAPTNDAFRVFFEENPVYGGSISSVPYDKLLNLVRYHIIQNPWNRMQLQSLNPSGWVTDDDHPINSKPWSYKRQTLLNEPNEKYYYLAEKGVFTIVDSIQSNRFRYVYSGKRKYAPIYFSQFFDLNGLNSDDYFFYYKRPFEPGNIYFGGAKMDAEIFAENGFIYPVDRVEIPARNGKQILEQGINNSSYKAFLSLMNQFPEFLFNREATFRQATALAGLQFDSLYNLTYPELLINIHDEEYKGSGLLSTQRHYGLMVPNDQAFTKFVDEILTSKSGYPRWDDLSVVPKEIKKLIINAHMSEFPVYKTNITKGFFNGVKDKVVIPEAIIEEKYYGSNCTFLGLSEAIIPRAFSSVTSPIYLRPGYSTFMRAMEFTQILPAIKRENSDYAFFVLSDERMALDSSLLLSWIDVDLNRYEFRVFSRSEELARDVSRQELTLRILNQVGISRPKGIASKEFIENLAGNYIMVNNLENTAQGSAPNTYGYIGDSAIVSNMIEFPEPTDNGKTYNVDTWFTYSKPNLFALVSSYPKFYQLLIKAGLIDEKTYKFTFIKEDDYFTVFAPTDQALINAGADTLSIGDLGNVLKYHFINGQLIFTDGNKPYGVYQTMQQMDDLSKYKTVILNPGIDYIDILDAEGSLIYRVNESAEQTNRMGITSTGTTYWDFITTSVVHSVEKLILK